MNINIRSRNKIAVTVAIVTVMLVGTMTVSLGDNSAFATKEKNQDVSQD